MIILISYFQLADCYGMEFFEVSCRGDINVQETFRSLARAVRDKRQRKVRDWKKILKFLTYIPQ